MKESPKLGDEYSWFISSIILFFITVILYLTSILEKTFLFLIFVLPTLLSAGFSIYILIKKLKLG